MSAETMRDRFATVTTEILDRDPRAALVLADISAARFRETGALERHPDRVINVGIREQLMIGVGAGMALEGLRPIIHSYAPFLVERPFEQIKLDLSHQVAGAVLVSTGASYDASAEGRTHQCPGDVALISSLPGWTIHVPGHRDEAEALLRDAMAAQGCVYIRLSDQQSASPHLDAAVEGFDLVRAGSPGAPAVVAVGPMLERTLEAAAGLDVTILYAVTVRPVPAALLSVLRDSRDIVFVEPYLEGTTLPGLAGALSGQPCRYLSIGVPNTELRRYGTPADHDRAHGLDPRGIRERLEAFLRGTQPSVPSG